MLVPRDSSEGSVASLASLAFNPEEKALLCHIWEKRMAPWGGKDLGCVRNRIVKPSPLFTLISVYSVVFFFLYQDMSNIPNLTSASDPPLHTLPSTGRKLGSRQREKDLFRHP